MAQENDDIFIDRAKDTTKTGRDIPGGDGTVSDEDMNAISSGKKIRKPDKTIRLKIMKIQNRQAASARFRIIRTGLRTSRTSPETMRSNNGI